MTRLFVGRKSEMGLLHMALEDALAGRGRIVMLGGEPGIGKTRIGQEIGIYARSADCHTLHGRCVEQVGPTPYWPWVQVIRAYIREASAAQLHAEMGLGAAHIAELAPEVRQKLPGLAIPPSHGDAERGRVRLFDALTTFLLEAARHQPLALIFDNLHWADRSSLQLLEFLAEELIDARLLVVGAYRDTELPRGHPLSQALGEFAKLPHCQQLSLTGLTEDEVADYAAHVCGGAPPPALVRELHSRTSGNPLFVTEVMRLLQSQGLLSPNMSADHLTFDMGLPIGVREAIRRRLDRLSPACNRVLTLASMIGQQFDLTALERLLDDLSSERVLDALDEALAAGIVEEVSEAFGRYHFSHILIQETLVGELSASRRTRMHARIATVLEQLWQNDLEAHASELSMHFACAEAILGSHNVVVYARMAAEKALAAYAYEDALAHFEKALAAKAGQPMDAETAALLFGLGCAQGATDQDQLAWNNLERAFDYYVEVNDTAQAARIAAHPLFFVPGLSQTTRMTKQALQFTPSDSLEAGRLLCRYGQLLNLEMADYQGAQQALTQALAIARRAGDAALEMRALANLADVHWYHLNWPDVVSYSIQTLDLASRVGDVSEVWPYYLASTGCWVMGKPEEARRYSAAMLQHAERLHNRGLLVNAWLQTALAPQLQGEWASARHAYDRGLDIAPTWYLLLGYRAQLEYEAGDFNTGRLYLDKFLDVALNTPFGPTGEHSFAALLPPLMARITGVPYRLDVTEEVACRMRASPALNPLMMLDLWHGLALLAVHQDDAAMAQEPYDTLAPMAGAMLQGLMSTDRVLGLLARTLGDIEAAAAHFEQALSFCRMAGYRPELAWTCHDYAETLLALPHSDHPAQAQVLLTEGMQIARELGMTPVLQQCAQLHEQLLSQKAMPVYPAGLTERESEVLRLMAAGMTNRDIATALFISPHTVNFHVKKIFSKTGAANRAEASAFAARHGLG